MDGYTEIINRITVGNHTQYLNKSLTQDEAGELLQVAVKKLRLTDLHPRRETDKCYESPRYFVYIASFPCLHIGIDNRAGTDRLFSITTAGELDQVPV